MNFLLKSHKTIFKLTKLNCSIYTPLMKYSKNEDFFGSGSKFVELDPTSKKYKDIKKYELEQKASSDDSDTFGTLASEIDQLELKNSIGYTKSIHDLKETKRKNETKQDEVEKKYDKVLNHIRLSNEDRPNTEQYYGHKINELVKNGKIKEAIDVFFVEMIEKDRFKPTLWLYKTLMRPLAQQGYTHMVFELFKKITTRGDDDWNDVKNVTKLHQIITLLFQSCANSPWKEYSIRKCDSIRFYLKHRQITPNTKNYSAMILAYGKAGAIYEAFNVVDEMIYNRIKPDSDVINNLLCACISQPNYGFRYALMAWQMSLKLKILPDINMYNLLLKAANDCNISLKKDRVNLQPSIHGHQKFLSNDQNLFPKNTQEYKEFSDDDLKSLMEPMKNEKEKDESTLSKEISKLNKDTFEKIDSNKELVDSSSGEILKLNREDVHVIEDLKVVGKSLEKQIKNLEWWQDIKANIDKHELLKGLTNFRPEIKEIILSQGYESLLTRFNENIEKDVFDYVTNEIDSPQGHLVLLGGVEGLLKSMISHKVRPDFKTFNITTQLLPDNLESENDLLSKMKKFGITPDIDLINLLIKRRISRNDRGSADEAFNMIQEHKLSPNIMTFGCLAFKIDKHELLVQFLNDLTEMNFKLNPIIISTLYSKGRYRKDMRFMSYLFDFILDNNLKIDQKLVDKMNRDLDSMKRELIRLERQTEKRDEVYYNRLRRFYNSFKRMFDEWIHVVKIEKQSHPYAKFARKDDKLYESFLSKTQRFQKSEENLKS